MEAPSEKSQLSKIISKDIKMDEENENLFSLDIETTEDEIQLIVTEPDAIIKVFCQVKLTISDIHKLKKNLVSLSKLEQFHRYLLELIEKKEVKIEKGENKILMLFTFIFLL